MPDPVITNREVLGCALPVLNVLAPLEVVMPLSDTEIKKILTQIKSIAIIGAKDKEGQPVDRVGRYLIAQGYQVIPVHPVRKDVWGLTTYRALNDLPEGVFPDAVVLFRASEYCEAHAREVLQLKPLPKVFWMQEGIFCPEALGLMEEAGVAALQNVCIKIEHERLVAGIQLGRL